ncbi:HAD-IA family hydrolase [Nonomuraea sp. NN258]|uniref:HAD-IA family hydrolase n=1 Tax=Nonomuraea antri TaxID=2730852 RepID=UPI001568C1DD|nr:HAD-IA family hydrolase [Nonomuraea antri]NRQ39699.1 HAD-IA family hydrolase [Nonomuraea antri]
MRWVTFDCYGTLIDWRHGIATAADLIAPGYGMRLLEAYNRHEPAVEAESPAMRYRQVLAESLRRACADERVPLSDDDVGVLAETLPYWPVFPDVAAELSALRADGRRLALLTNCDRDLVAQTLRRLPVRFDAIVTAEDVGSYKPAHGHFTRFREWYEPDEWVHVAQSYVHDLVPAHELGLRRIWINRHGAEPADPSIVQDTLPGLRGLRDLIG